MSTAETQSLISVDNYLAGELLAERKREYVAGVVYAMAGGTNVHSLIASNALGTLHAQLEGRPCRPYNSDTKIRIRTSNQTRFYYPDASVVCQPNPMTDTFQDAPAVLIEVLSRSTRRLDEGEKREGYLTIPSLGSYVLLEQVSAAAVVYQRGEQGFERHVYQGLDSKIPLPGIDAELSLAKVYEAVEFSSEPEAAH